MKPEPKNPLTWLDALPEPKKREAEVRLERRLLEALNSGPATPMTQEHWESIRQRVRQSDG
jgi:hypothetical protein